MQTVRLSWSWAVPEHVPVHDVCELKAPAAAAMQRISCGPSGTSHRLEGQCSPAVDQEHWVRTLAESGADQNTHIRRSSVPNPCAHIRQTSDSMPGVELTRTLTLSHSWSLHVHAFSHTKRTCTPAWMHSPRAHPKLLARLPKCGSHRRQITGHNADATGLAQRQR
jgi:hypothetical protein